MMSKVSLFAMGTIVLTFLAIALYRRVWIASRGTEITSTGFGVFLPLVVFIALLIAHAPIEWMVAFAIIAVASVVYWFDDLFGLSARLRLGLSFVTGVAVCASVLHELGDVPLWMLCASCAVAGIVNIVLTNIVNFYDGADLNLATFIALTGAVLFCYHSDDTLVASIAVACMAFTAPFAVINSRPKTIYLGDAGSFAFASLLTFLVVVHFSQGRLAPETAIPVVLPAIDTFYVFCVRVIERHDLMTRNYLHLYQKLNQNYRGFAYLAPQLINVMLLLTSATILHYVGMSSVSSVVIVSVVISVPFYLLCRGLFIPMARASGAE